MTVRGRSLTLTVTEAFMLLAAIPAIGSAHDGRPLEPHDLWSAWNWNPAIVLPLVLVAYVYGAGVRRVWSRSARGRGVRQWEALSFASGWIALVFALISPLHALGSALFSAHMTQHELMMVVAAPLLVIGRPFVACAWGLPRSWRRQVRVVMGANGLRDLWQLMSAPAVATIAHAVAVGVWHVPGPYQATLTSGVAHGLQHLAFFWTAVLFWWVILRPRRASRGQAVIYLFVTTLWTGALGALLAFAPELWYPQYAATTGAWGLTPLEDQQLGGIIMWIPGGVSYLVAALALLALWLTESERRAHRHGLLAIADRST
jgi:cytochrome c oxidase assembly factor CtaG